MIESVLDIPASQKDRSQSDGRLAGVGVDQWQELTERIAKHGDQQAFAEYYKAFFDTMFLTVKHTTGCDEATCLDIVQDAMIKVIAKMKPLDTRQQTIAWTRAVAKTTAYDFLRKRARQQKLSENRANQTTETKQHVIDDIARLTWVEEQLRQLPDELISMISLKYRMGWTLRQIGEKFGLKTGAVDGKIRRAIDELKSQAREEFCNE
ncbi:RNA polymerase sigma factor [Mariniblastus sp.]|nr:RNA polymerase sigma factor [Mariniblastus sp.]